MSKALIIEVFKENEVIDVREGVSHKTGKPWKMFTQIGYAHVGEKFPVQFKIKMQEGQLFYPEGKYELSPLSLAISPYGDLEVGRTMILTPLK